MLKKLKRKFVAINMLLVSLVLLAVFATIAAANYSRERESSRAVLMQTLDGPGRMRPPRLDVGKPPEPKDAVMMPSLLVLLDENGAVIKTEAQNLQITDAALREIVAQARESGKNEGFLSAYSLRYLLRADAKGERLAFVDVSNQLSSLRRQLLSYTAILLGALLAFFAVSYFLASWALRPAERAWEQQKRFISDASHELKTPLTVILANTDIMLSHGDETVERQGKWLAGVREEGMRMKGLIDDLLLLAKTDEGWLQLTLSEVELSDLVWRALLPFEAVAYEQGASLESDIEEKLFVRADGNKLSQIVKILLDNACKYGGRGGSVKLTLDKWQNQARLRVQNSGAPIAPEELPHVFDRFYRTDASRDSRTGGCGLGLSIAQSLARLHGASLSAQSAPETGTVFELLLALSK